MLMLKAPFTQVSKVEASSGSELNLIFSDLLFALGFELFKMAHPDPEVIKKKFMRNSAEHDISDAHKYKIPRKASFFQAQVKLECYFFCL